MLDRRLVDAFGQTLDALIVLRMRPGEDAAVAELTVGRVDQPLLDPLDVRFVSTYREAKRESRVSRAGIEGEGGGDGRLAGKRERSRSADASSSLSSPSFWIVQPGHTFSTCQRKPLVSSVAHATRGEEEETHLQVLKAQLVVSLLGPNPLCVVPRARRMATLEEIELERSILCLCLLVGRRGCCGG